MIPTDAAALAALETQLHQLTTVIARLLAARSHLVPAKATFWSGPARERYDVALHELDRDLAGALEAVRFAQRNTRLGLEELERRG